MRNWLHDLGVYMNSPASPEMTGVFTVLIFASLALMLAFVAFMLGPILCEQVEDAWREWRYIIDNILEDHRRAKKEDTP